MSLCPICGWSDRVKQPCTTVMQAIMCDLNQENWRKYVLRHKGQIAREELPVPTLVRSDRGFDPANKDGPGRGNAREELVPVSVEAAKELLKTSI